MVAMATKDVGFGVGGVMGVGGGWTFGEIGVFQVSQSCVKRDEIVHRLISPQRPVACETRCVAMLLIFVTNLTDLKKVNTFNTESDHSQDFLLTVCSHSCLEAG